MNFSLSSAGDAIYPLLCGQRWLLHVRRDEPSLARPVQRIYRLQRALDTSALLAAFRHVVSVHPSLRLNLVRINDGFAQRFLPLTGDIAGVAVRGRTAELRSAYAHSVLAADAERPFDLAKEPPHLARIVDVDGERYLSLCLDHLAADEIAADILEVELAKAYAREVRAQPQPPSRADAFFDYLRLEPSRRTKETRNLEYWTRQLAGAPLASSSSEDLSWVPGHVCSWELPAVGLRELERACRTLQCSVFTVVLAAQAELLFRAAQTDDLVLNVPVSNRVMPDEHTWVANLTMLLHLRLRRPAAVTPGKWVTIIRDQQLDAIAHRQVDYSGLTAAVSEEAASRGGHVQWLIGSSFIIERSRPPLTEELFAERLGERDGDRVSVPSGSCAFTARQSSTRLRISVVWDPGQWPLTAARIQDDYLATICRLTNSSVEIVR